VRLGHTAAAFNLHVAYVGFAAWHFAAHAEATLSCNASRNGFAAILLCMYTQGQHSGSTIRLINSSSSDSLGTEEDVSVPSTGASDDDSDSVRASSAGETCACGQSDSRVQSSNDDEELLLLYDIEFHSVDDDSSSARNSTGKHMSMQRMQSYVFGML
jgi:hypothetical protein